MQEKADDFHFTGANFQKSAKYQEIGGGKLLENAREFPANFIAKPGEEIPPRARWKNIHKKEMTPGPGGAIMLLYSQRG